MQFFDEQLASNSDKIFIYRCRNIIHEGIKKCRSEIHWGWQKKNELKSSVQVMCVFNHRRGSNIFGGRGFALPSFTSGYCK